MQAATQPMKKYHVSGTFSYFPDGATDEKLKAIDTTVVALNVNQAGEKALEEYDVIEGEEPTWLFGYPTVDFLEDVYTGESIRDYWMKAR